MFDTNELHIEDEQEQQWLDSSDFALTLKSFPGAVFII